MLTSIMSNTLVLVTILKTSLLYLPATVFLCSVDVTNLLVSYFYDFSFAGIFFKAENSWLVFRCPRWPLLGEEIFRTIRDWAYEERGKRQVERGKPERENQQQTQPSCGVEAGDWTWATLSALSYGAVKVIWASPRFEHPYSQNPSDMGIVLILPQRFGLWLRGMPISRLPWHVIKQSGLPLRGRHVPVKIRCSFFKMMY